MSDKHHYLYSRRENDDPIEYKIIDFLTVMTIRVLGYLVIDGLGFFCSCVKFVFTLIVQNPKDI